MGKPLGLDGVSGGMLKYDGETVVEWMWKMCRLAWEEIVPADRNIGVIIPVCMGKEERTVCSNHRGGGISLLSV